MKALLVWLEGGTPAARELSGVGLTVGRADECDLQLAAPGVSSRHCRVALLDGSWTVEDLDSSNGTFVNGELIVTRRRLAHGDELRLGNAGAPLFRARFELAPAAEPASATLQVRCAELEAALAGLRAAQANRDAVEGDLHARIRDLEGRLSDQASAVADLAELRTVHAGVRDDLTASRERVVQLETQLDERRRQARAALDEVERRRRKLEKELATLQVELAETRHKLEVAAGNAVELKRANELLLAEVAALRE